MKEMKCTLSKETKTIKSEKSRTKRYNGNFEVYQMSLTKQWRWQKKDSVNFKTDW